MTGAGRAIGQSVALPRPAAGSRPEVASVVLALAGVVMWYVAVGQTQLSTMNDLGLMSAVGVWFWLALASVVTAFVLALRREQPRTAVVLLALVVLIVIVMGTPAAIEGTPRLEASYRHLGLIDQISGAGRLDRTVDAYFSWPGFFSLMAMLGEASGIHDFTPLATFAPMLAALAYLPPLFLILRSLTTNVRIQWLALGLFYALNWTGQDYLSPQTFSFWLYLCVLALVLRLAGTSSDDFLRPEWLRRRLPAGGGLSGTRQADEGRVTARTARALLALVAVDILAVVASHQLTPFVLIVSLGVLWFVGRGKLWLVVLAGSATVLWLLFPAWPFVSGHLDDIVGGFGNITGAAQANVTSRMLNGSPEHRIVVAGRIAEALAAWLLAMAGVYLLRRRKLGAVGPLLLFASPFLLLPLQSYGGEMIIRVYLFSLPLTGFLGAMALSRLTDASTRSRVDVLRSVLLVVVISLITGATLVARYGNERGESFRPDEVRAMAAIYQQNDAKAVVLALTQNTPWRYHRYSTFDYRYLESAEPGEVWKKPLSTAGVVRELSMTSGAPEYVLYTRSQSAMADLSANTSTGAVASVAQDLAGDPRFQVIHRSPNALVLRMISPNSS